MSEKNKMKGVEIYNSAHHEQLRRSIREAFIKMLKTKSFESISISDLCTVAGVSRTGFYSNYKNKSEVLEENVHEIIDDLNNEVGPMQHVHNDLDYYVRLFQFVKKNKTKYKIIMDANFEGKYLEIVNSIVINHPNLSEEDKVRRIVWTGAIINITVWWIYMNEKIDVKDMALYCFNLLEKK